MTGVKKLLTAILVLAMLTTVFLVGMPGVRAESAELPTWQIGDKWVYVAEYDDPPMTLNMTIEVIGETTVTVDGTSYDVYKYSFSYEAGETIQISYVAKSTLGTVKTERDGEVIGTSNPPPDKYKFPINVGDSWTSAYTHTSWEDSHEWETYYETHYNCTEITTITVPAGTYSCYKIVGSDMYEQDSLKYIYYSPDVKNVVKSVSCEYDNSTDTWDNTTISLKSYSNEGGAVTDGTDEGGEKKEEKGFIPGFETVFLLAAVGVSIVLLRKKHR